MVEGCRNTRGYFLGGLGPICTPIPHRWAQTFACTIGKPGLDRDQRQLLAGVSQSIQMSARGQTLTDRSKLLASEIINNPGPKHEVLDRVYHKGGGCLAVDGSKVRVPPCE